MDSILVVRRLELVVEHSVAERREEVASHRATRGRRAHVAEDGAHTVRRDVRLELLLELLPELVDPWVHFRAASVIVVVVAGARTKSRPGQPRDFMNQRVLVRYSRICSDNEDSLNSKNNRGLHPWAPMAVSGLLISL